MIGDYLKYVPGCPELADARYVAKRKTDHITLDNIENELIDNGYGDSYVCVIMHIPDEHQPEKIDHVDIYSMEAACKELAWSLGWTVYDHNGKQLTDRRTVNPY